jgi:hypothetical protein
VLDKGKKVYGNGYFNPFYPVTKGKLFMKAAAGGKAAAGNRKTRQQATAKPEGNSRQQEGKTENSKAIQETAGNSEARQQHAGHRGSSRQDTAAG